MIDEKFWSIIKKMKWSKDFNNERISTLIEQGEYGNKEIMFDFLNKYNEKFNRIYEYASSLIDTGYDEFLDEDEEGRHDLMNLLYNIIGYGEKDYNSVFKNKQNFFKYKKKSKGFFNFSFDLLKREKYNKDRENKNILKNKNIKNLKNLNSSNNILNINMDFI